MTQEAPPNPNETLFAEIMPFEGEQQAGPAPMPVPMQQAKTQFMTAVAVQKPRVLSRVIAAVMEEATHAKESFYYSFPMGGKKVEGPSIGLAMAVAREWGNCAVPMDYQETMSEWVFNASFVDLERGFTVSRVFRQPKGKGRFTKLDAARAEDMTFQAAQSKAIRNVVAAGVPRWLISQAIDKAKEAVLASINKEGIVAAGARALNFLAGYGITQERVEAVLAVEPATSKPVADWTPEDIATLRGMASQLKDGQASPGKLFPVIEARPFDKPAEEGPKVKTVDPEQQKAQQAPEQAPPPDLPPPGDQVTVVAQPGELATGDPPSFVDEVKALWRLSVEKGIDMKKMNTQFDIQGMAGITPMNIDGIRDWVQKKIAAKAGKKK